MRCCTVVPDQCAGAVTEERISERAFALLFAFDEIITAGGYNESTTIQQIRTNMVCIVLCGTLADADVVLDWFIACGCLR